MKGLSQSGTYPSGNPRFYLRMTGQKAIPMPDYPRGDARFLKAYTDALSGVLPQQSRSPTTGTLAAGVVAYIASDKFLAYSPATRALRRRALEDLRKRYGQARQADVRPRHIRADLDRFSAHAANTRLKVWRGLCAFLVDKGWIDRDPARDVRPREVRTVGFEPWSRADLEAFRQRWPVGTTQRLACELMYQIGCSAVDVCRLGPANVRAGWCTYRRSKSKTTATAPFTLETSPAWYEPSPFLAQCIGLAPKHLTFLTTQAGRSRSPKAFSQWFSKACRDAGVSKSAHGLRKLRSIVMAENGATPDQRQRILGHDTTHQTLEYSAAADARRIISGTDFSNTGDQVGKREAK